jgi:citrate synthase
MNYKYREKADLVIVRSDSRFQHAEDFMRMFKARKRFTRQEALLLDQFLILHAEHGGGNNSTFTTRVVSSSETDTFSAVSAALASLKGHLHGGANEQVMNMMGFVRAGWCAHRLEQLVQNRLIRPAYRDLVERRPYVPLESRSD